MSVHVRLTVPSFGFINLCKDLCDRAGELKICMKCGKESHEGACKDTATATESDSARGKITMLFPPEEHPSSNEAIEMEVPDDDEEMAPMSSEPHEKPHQLEVEEPIFFLREEFHKYNYVVNLPEMADLAEGGELHVGQLDLYTNPNGVLKEYNHMLDLFGGASPSVIPQPGDEAVCEGVQGYSCMTSTQPKGLHLEVMSMQNRDTSFPYLPYNEYTAFGYNIHHSNWPKVGEPYSLEWRRMGEHRHRYKKSDKFQMIAECIRSEDRRHTRKPRLQVVAAKFDQEIDMETMAGLIAAR